MLGLNRRHPATPRARSRCECQWGVCEPLWRHGGACELVYQRAERGRAVSQLASSEAVNPLRESSGDVRVFEVGEEEVQLHVLYLGEPS